MMRNRQWRGIEKISFGCHRYCEDEVGSYRLHLSHSLEKMRCIARCAKWDCTYSIEGNKLQS